MSRIATPSRLHFGLVAVVLGTLLASQGLILLLSQAPSSITAWMLYFEYARRVDVVFRIFTGSGAHLDAEQFVAVLCLLLIAGEAAVRYRIKLLEALVLHAVLGVVILVMLDNLGALPTSRAVAGVIAGPGFPLVLALMIGCGGPIAAACIHHHIQYLREARSRPHLPFLLAR